MLHSQMPFFQKSGASSQKRHDAKKGLLAICVFPLAGALFCSAFICSSGIDRSFVLGSTDDTPSFDANLFLEVHPSPSLSPTQVAKVTLLGLSFNDVTQRKAGLRAAFRLSLGDLGPLRGVRALEEALTLSTYAPLQGVSSTISISKAQEIQKNGPNHADNDQDKTMQFWIRVRSPQGGTLRSDFYKMTMHIDSNGIWRVRSIGRVSEKEMKKARHASYDDVVKDEFPLDTCFKKWVLGDVHGR